MTFDIEKYKKLYVGAALEILEKMVSLLSQKIISPSEYPILHRSAHSLKGQSLAMGYERLGRLEKKMEDYFNQLIEEKKQISESQKQILIETVSAITQILKSQPDDLNYEHLGPLKIDKVDDLSSE